MKKRMTTLLAVMTAGVVILGGCAQSKGLKTKELEITQYKGVEVAQLEKPEEITDEAVEQAVQTRREMAAVQTEITDRPVQSGDTVYIDFVGKIDGVEFEGGSSQNYPLVIGSGSFIEGFEDSIIGHQVGETFDWNGKFPDDYTNTDYAGKDVVFTITVNTIEERKLPELNEDFVKDNSEKSKTVEEFKKEIKEGLETDSETQYNQQLQTNVWTAVMENTTVQNYPQDRIDEYIKKITDEYTKAAEANGVKFDEFIQTQMQMSVEDFNAKVEEVAKENVKQLLASEAIAKKEKIKLSDKEYEEEINKMAEMYGYESADDLKEIATEEELKDAILFERVKSWLAENCIQVAP